MTKLEIKKWVQLSKLGTWFLHKWYSVINNFSKGIYKTKFVCEEYLNVLLRKLRTLWNSEQVITVFLELLVVGINYKVMKESEICIIMFNQIGDEFHYLLEYNVLSSILEKKLARKYYVQPNHSNITKFCNLLLNTNSKCKEMCHFITKIYEVCSPKVKRDSSAHFRLFVYMYM